MDDIIRLCKKKGFVFQSSEIYGPMSGFYDFGPLGVEMKNNIKKLWWRDMVQKRDNVVGIDCSIISSPQIWQASGHVEGFSDPMVDCKESKLRFRADQVFWSPIETVDGEILSYITVQESENMEKEALSFANKILKKLNKTTAIKSLKLVELTKAPLEIYNLLPSPATGNPGQLTLPREFNLMFQTNVGAITEESNVTYLRPETAQVGAYYSLN
jgi:glycyl-tRNA synthetase